MAIASLPEVGWALSRCQPLAGTSQRENPCRQSPCYIVYDGSLSYRRTDVWAALTLNVVLILPPS